MCIYDLIKKRYTHTHTVRDVLTSCFRAESPRSATGIALSGFCSTKFLLLFFGLCYRSAQVGGKAPAHGGRSRLIREFVGGRVQFWAAGKANNRDICAHTPFFTGREHTHTAAAPHQSLWVSFLSRNLKKAVTFLRQKRRTIHSTLKKMAGSGGRACRGISLVKMRDASVPFSLLCGYFGGWVIRGCFAPWPGSLRCLIVPSYSPWVFGLCAQAQHTHSVRTHRQSVVVSPRSFD
jgi:hypothetical protein